MFARCCCTQADGQTPVLADQLPSSTGGPEKPPASGGPVPPEPPAIAPPEPASAPPPVGAFIATLVRASSSQATGMSLEAFEPSNNIFITSVAEDPSTIVGSYNATAPRDQLIMAGDFIVAIEGASSIMEMRKEMMGNQFRISIQRPRHTKVTVPKLGKHLGLGIKYDPAGTCLTIHTVSATGAAHAAGVGLAPGDRIVGVNGAAARATTMLAELRDSASPELTISRCLAC